MACDNQDLIAAGSHRLLYTGLDDGFIDQRQHLFGLGLGCGQEAGPQASGGEYGFANFHGHRALVRR
jgi:hypothetical protein